MPNNSSTCIIRIQWQKGLRKKNNGNKDSRKQNKIKQHKSSCREAAGFTTHTPNPHVHAGLEKESPTPQTKQTFRTRTQKGLSA
jgi:hypothetical protein